MGSRTGGARARSGDQIETDDCGRTITNPFQVSRQRIRGGHSAIGRALGTGRTAPALSAALALLLLFFPGHGLAQQGAPNPTADQDGPPVLPRLAGCRLPLPGGADRDSGLAEQHVRRQQGRAYLLAPSITLRQTYSDNITLVPEDKESDFITQFIPALTFCRVGPRLRAQADYQGIILRYWDDSDRNDIFHRLNGDTTTTLIRDRLFLDAGATHGQQPISSRGAFSDDNALITGNRTDALHQPFRQLQSRHRASRQRT